MVAKTYRGRTIQEATANVRNTLGPDAMILSTKKLKEEGRQTFFEITAVPAGRKAPPKGSTPLPHGESGLLSIREMTYLLDHSGAGMERLAMNLQVLNLYGNLIRSGIHDLHARLFLERAGVFHEDTVDGQAMIKEKVIREIQKCIHVIDPFDTKENGQSVAAFIGTTGVGKTTTIAKIAARLILDRRKKVGLISLDTYRIGAMEQLKTYAHILGIPCFQAFKRKDLLFAFRRMEGHDVILIDTAGQSQYDKERIEELMGMVTGPIPIHTHLLLSVPTAGAEMKRTAMNFRPLKFQSYIFTKCDEAERYGPVLNQLMTLQAPISYMTTGQNVPEDIEKADQGKILDGILNYQPRLET